VSLCSLQSCRPAVQVQYQDVIADVGYCKVKAVVGCCSAGSEQPYPFGPCASALSSFQHNGANVYLDGGLTHKPLVKSPAIFQLFLRYTHQAILDD
jgi:hypothetical protein